MRSSFWIALALLLTLFAPSAKADDGSVARARVHFANGIKLYDAVPPDYAGALAEFEEAYRAKPSPGIKRNIALCLKGLQRYPEAIDALEQMQSEGGDTLTPAVREAAAKAIAELNAMIATVRLRIVPHVTNTRVPKVALFVDDVQLTQEKFAAPLRLMPGQHVFKARATGFFEALQTATLEAGDKDVAVVIELVAIEIVEKGRLTVRANVSTATIAIDGITVGTERWTGDLRAGMHRIDVVAQGYPAYAVSVVVPANESRELPVDMGSTPIAAPAPDPYQKTTPVPKADPNWFVSGGLTFQTESLHFGPALDESEGGASRSLSGFGFVAHLGRRLTPYLDGLILGEIGGLAPPDYQSPQLATTAASVRVTTWTLAPELRVHTRGSVRGLAGVAVGFEGHSVSGELGYTDTTGASLVKKVSGGAAAGMFLFEVGGQIDLGRGVFLEGTAFADLHGVGGATDSVGGQRFFLSSPAVRGGARVLLGYAF